MTPRSRPAALAALALAAAAPAPAQEITLTVPVDTLVARTRRDSTDPGTWYDAALGLWVHRRWAEADASLRRALAIEPRFAPAHLALAFLPFAERDRLWEEQEKGKVPEAWRPRVEDAYVHYRRAFLLDPMVDLKPVGLINPRKGKLYVGSGVDRYYANLIVGFEAFWGGNYFLAWERMDESIREGKKKVGEEPPDFLHWYRGLAAAHLQNWPGAIGDFEGLLARAQEREKTDSVQRLSILRSNDLRYILANLYLRANRLDDAQREFESAVSQDLSLDMAHARLADISEKRGRWADAITERRRAIETNPEDPGLLVELGTTQARAGAYDDALVTLAQAEAALPLNARIPYLIGRVHVARRDLPQAKVAFVRFASLAPPHFRGQVREAEQLVGPLQ
jgi:tetratricopeptide (TPR) repeat protein